jgi:hypothetical protein
MPEGRFTVSIVAADTVGNTGDQKIRLTLIEGEDASAGGGGSSEPDIFDILSFTDNLWTLILLFMLILIGIFLAVTYFGRDRS